MDISGNRQSVAPETAESEVLQLENHIITLEQKIEERYYQLGKSIYELTDRRVDEINHLVGLLIETKSRLCSLTVGSCCTVCGSANAMNSRFCSQCGSDLEQERNDDE